MPSRASSSGGVDRADQNAACELNPNSESPQALSRVRVRTFRGRCRTGPATVGTGPVPSGCHCTVIGPGGTSRFGSRTAGAVMSCPASGFGEGPGRPVVAGRVGSPGGGELLLTPRACAASTMVVSVASHGEPSVHPWLCRAGPAPVAGLLFAFPSPRKEHHRGRSAGHRSHRRASPTPGRVVGDELAVRTAGVAAIHWVECGVAVTPVAWGNALPRGWFRCGHAQEAEA